MIKKIKRTFLGIFGTVIGFVFSSNALGQYRGMDMPVYGVNSIPRATLGQQIMGIINYALGVVFIAIPFIVGIVAYLKQRKGKKIKQTILWGLAGMVFVVILFIAAHVLDNILS